MPGGDRTGPLGEGPMTGRQLGYGAGYNSPGFTKGPGGGLGRGFFGRGSRFGRGYRRGFFNWDWRASESVENQPDSINQLKSEIQYLQNGLTSIQERLNTLTVKEEDK